jgi:hypothetical protein
MLKLLQNVPILYVSSGAKIMLHIRFWVFVNDGFVRLSLKDGQSLKHSWFCRTDEGYDSARTRWTRDGDFITRDYETAGCDCDGPLNTSNTCRWTPSDGTFLASEYRDGKQVSFVDTPIPEWQKVCASRQDVYAEAMGY